MDEEGVAPVSLHGDRIFFREPVAPAPAEGLPDIAPLRFHAAFASGRTQVVNLETFPVRPLAEEAARILLRETAATGYYNSPGHLEDAVQALRRFGDYLVDRRLTDETASMADIRAAHVDGFEDYLYERHGDQSGVPYKRVGPFVLLLRFAERYGLTSGELTERLKFVSRRGVQPRSSKPREPYSPYVAEQMRAAATKDLLDAVDRITREGAVMVERGEDPVIGGWKRPSNLLWAIKHQGFATAADAPPELQDRIKAYPEYSGTPHSLGSLVRMVHLTLDEMLACAILLSLSTGLPIESIDELRADCLRNEARGFADLVYEKRRRGGNRAPAPIRVRVDEHMSAGAVIKTVISLTRTTRRFAPAGEREWLFVGYARPNAFSRSALRRLTYTHEACSRFCDRHEIRDDQGSRVAKVTPARLRKTYKAERYLAAPGLAAAAGDHTRQVHDRHYANVEALRDVHEAAIASALEAAASNSLEPIVVPGDAERLVMDGDPGAVERSGLTAAQARLVASGDQDVWVATCLDHENSPYQESGTGPCRSPVWGCLSCRNAVITSSKLPSLLAFLDHVLESRSRMDLETWRVRFGDAHARITQQILPRFPAKEVALARTIAEAQHDLLWLPAELTRSD